MTMTNALTSLRAVCLSLCLPALLWAGCPAASGGEGEGEPGEGEGDPAEGEGEGDAAEGEGDPAEGEGEGDPAEGEGEGDPAGEGEGEVDVDVGGRANPLSQPLPIIVEVNIDVADDEDCFAFTTERVGVLHVRADYLDCPSISPDPRVALYAAADTTTAIDDDDDSGEGYCALLDVRLDPGDYVLCAGESGDSDPLAGISLTAELEELITLGIDAPCDPASDTAACDASIGARCLVVNPPDDRRCAVPAPLGLGQPCVPGSEAAICDLAQNQACVDQGSGPACTLVGCGAPFAAEQTVSGALFEPIAGFVDVEQPSCTSTRRPESVYTYTASTFSNLHVRAFDTAVVYARRQCDAGGEEIACDTTPSEVIVPTVQAGETVYLFFETNAGQRPIVDVDETPVVVLGEGAACTRGNLDAVCDVSVPGLACRSAGAGAASTCALPITVGVGETCSAADTLHSCTDGALCLTGTCQVSQGFLGNLDAGDPTVSRATSSCSSSTTVVPFESYAVQNGGAATEMTIVTHRVGDAGECDYDSYLHVYGAFDPAAPTAQCLRGDDDSGPGSCAQLTMPLDAGQSVVVVVSAFSGGRGPYAVDFVSDGSLIVVPNQ